MISLGSGETFTPYGSTPSIYSAGAGGAGSGLMASNLAKIAGIPAISPYGTGFGVSLPQPKNTAGANTGDAIATGTMVNNQLPGYSTDINNIGSNITAETAGQLPQDVIQQLQQAGAERGVATGTQGSGANNAAYMKALGLNSLQLTNMGQSNLNAQTPNLPGAAISQNPAGYVSSALQEQSGIAGAEAAAAPNPYYAALNGFAAENAGYNQGGGSSVPPPSMVGKLPPTPGGGLDTGLSDFNSTPIVMGAGGQPQTPSGEVNPTDANSSSEWLQNILQSYGGTVQPQGGDQGSGE